MIQAIRRAQESGADRQRSVQSFLSAIFGRRTLHAALLLILVVAFVGSNELSADPDVWWHLADARMLFATHHFIRVEPNAFTVRGDSWINPEWLAEIPYWCGSSWFGLVGVHLVALAAFYANLLFIYFRSSWKARHTGAAFWTVVLCFFPMCLNAGARTILIAYLAMSAELLILEAAERGKPRTLWLLAPLFCIWVNLHGTWLIGLGLLALYAVCGMFPFKIGAFAQEGFSARDRNRLILVFAACAAALLVNPYGWRLIWNPLDIMVAQKVMVAATVEWQPLAMTQPAGKAMAIFICLMIVANLIKGRKWKLYELAFILFAFYCAFAHQRFALMACVIVGPWLAADLARSFFSESSEKTNPAINALFVAFAAGLFVYLLPKNSALQRDLAERYPSALISRIQPDWRTFNDHDLGGMLAYDLKPSFIDSRNDIFEHYGVLQDYLAIQGLQQPFGLLQRYQVDHALVQANSPLAFALRHSADWRLVMQEGAGQNTYALFAKAEK